RRARAGAVVRIGVTDAGAMNVDDDLAGSRFRVGQLAQLQRLVGFAESNRLHARMVSRVSPACGQSPCGAGILPALLWGGATKAQAGCLRHTGEQAYDFRHGSTTRRA